MKKITQKAFTLVEMMVVIGLMAILLLIILSSFSGQKIKAKDNMRISGLQEIRLALEEYKMVCGVYPNRLELDTNNGRYGVCSHKLKEFLPYIPENPNYGSSIDIIDTDSIGYYYRGLSTSTSNPCYEYYLGVQFENPENKELQKDHDWNKTGSYKTTCKGSKTTLRTQSGSDDNGWYDFRSQKSL